jgi:hypothetical protein
MLALVPAALLVASSASAAATFVLREGVSGRPFTIYDPENGVIVSGGTDKSIALKTIVSWHLDGSSPIYAGLGDAIDPRSVRPLADGSVLIVNAGVKGDGSGSFVAVVDRSGTATWSYGSSDDSDLRRPFCAEHMVRDGRHYTLIADRIAARVFAVDDATKEIVWQYGVAGNPGLGVDRLSDPYWATYVAEDDTVLIADNNEAHRVIEVRWADYAADAPPLYGFTAQSIVWQYGVAGEYGSAAGLLMKPRSPQRLPGGHTLITDADAQTVFEVDREGNIVWRFGVVGEKGTPQQGRLRGPTYAERLADGTTLIADSDNGLVVLVDAHGRLVASYDMAKLDPPGGPNNTDPPAPRMATPNADGSLLVADSGLGRYVEFGLPAEATITSQPLAIGDDDARKRFVGVAWQGETPGDSGVRLEYRVGGGAWKRSSTLTPSSPAVGKSIQYRVTLQSDQRTTSPRLDSVDIRWQKVVEEAKSNDDDAAATTGSGVAYMGGAGGSAGPTGAVAWGGTVSGTGYGSGYGGYGSGDGGAVSPGGGSPTAEAQVTSAPASVVDPAGSATTAMVTGSPMKLEVGDWAGTGGAGDGGASDGASEGAPDAFWAALLAVVLTAAVVPPLAGRRVQNRLDMTTDVPATVTRDARLLKGAG